MSHEKKDAPDTPDEENVLTTIEYSDTLLPPPPSNRPVITAIEGPIRDTRDRVTFSTTFIEDVDLLADYSLEYNQIKAIQTQVGKLPVMCFSELKREVKNCIDSRWDVYKKQFSIPDRMVAFKLISLDGDFYLGLNNGYLCFYKDPNLKDRTPFPLFVSALEEIRRPS